MSDDRNTDGRSITTERTLSPTRESMQTRSVSELPTDSVIYERGLSEPRLPIEPRSAGTLSDYAPSIEYTRELSPTREPIALRGTGRILDSTEPVTQVDVTPSQPVGQTLASYFSGGNAGGGRAYDNPITVVPGGEETGSNSNMGLILLVLAIAGGGAYWYYKQGGFQ